MKFVFCEKMDETIDHHVEPNNPDGKRQILQVVFHMWNLDQKKKKE
jgi:hypothetical protein